MRNHDGKLQLQNENHKLHGSSSVAAKLENTTACYRAPGWPDPEFLQRKTEKYLPSRISGTPQKNPICLKNTKHGCVWYYGGIFSVFSGNFGAKVGVQSFGPRGTFSVF